MDLQRDLQQKAQLLENGIHFMKSLVVVEACDADQVMFKSDTVSIITRLTSL